MTKPIILTNDPSITAWGWAVVKGDKILGVGCIKTEPEAKKKKIRVGDDFVRRVSDITHGLLDIINSYKVDYIISELPHGSQNANAAKMIGAVSSLMQGMAICLDKGIEWYSENDAKKTLLNKKSATKQDMINAVSLLYDIPWTGVKYKDEAMADAIAIYHTARKYSPTLKFLQ